ncbi:hypothetical protein MHYP_G00147150 [Metynnis hypsauchen]
MRLVVNHGPLRARRRCLLRTLSARCCHFFPSCQVFSPLWCQLLEFPGRPCYLCEHAPPLSPRSAHGFVGFLWFLRLLPLTCQSLRGFPGRRELHDQA